jgi:hypothetical protein
MTVGKIFTDPQKKWSRILPKLFVVDSAIFSIRKR